MRRTAVLAILAVLVLGCESRQHSIVRENGYVADHPVEEVAHYWDAVPWVTVSGRTLVMDISAPAGSGPFPCLMIIHGGGWELHTNTVMEGMARHVTNQGYAIFNINYRTLPEGADMKQIVEDCMGALIWVKEHAAEYGGDASRIAVTGDSAGGHLTAMIVTRGGDPEFTPTYRGNGATDLSITCAIPTYGVYDFPALTKAASPYVKKVLGASCEKDEARCREFSPIYHVHAGMPPELVLVGGRDPLLGQNQAYVDAVKQAGSPIELWVYPGQGHAFLNYFWDERGQKGCDEMVKFMDRELKGN
ncbi:MAG TPA: alpha/beta hydrolase [bacterium]|nr:alpha/beta hydrolase [bacterium]